MDTGAQQDASDSGAPASDTGTTEDVGASDKSTGIDLKGKGPAVPEVRTIPKPASAGQAAPTVPEQPAPKTPTVEKTPAPAKTAAPAKTFAPAKSGTLKIQPTKSGTPSAATAPSKTASRPSSALALHLGRAATRPGYRTSFFDTPELEGIVPLVTKSDRSLGSLAKPIPIACELLSLQQRLHLVADATNVSFLYTHPQSPKMSAVRDQDIRDFPTPFALNSFQIIYPAYIYARSEL
jgi:hypothetical protein